jgi:hypothetical protein
MGGIATVFIAASAVPEKTSSDHITVSVPLYTYTTTHNKYLCQFVVMGKGKSNGILLHVISIILFFGGEGEKGMAHVLPLHVTRESP